MMGTRANSQLPFKLHQWPISAAADGNPVPLHVTQSIQFAPEFHVPIPNGEVAYGHTWQLLIFQLETITRE